MPDLRASSTMTPSLNPCPPQSGMTTTSERAWNYSSWPGSTGVTGKTGLSGASGCGKHQYIDRYLEEKMHDQSASQGNVGCWDRLHRDAGRESPWATLCHVCAHGHGAGADSFSCTFKKRRDLSIQLSPGHNGAAGPLAVSRLES